MRNSVLLVIGVALLGGGAFVAGRYTAKSVYTEVATVGTFGGHVRSDAEAELLSLRSENAALRAELEAARTEAAAVAQASETQPEEMAAVPDEPPSVGAGPGDGRGVHRAQAPQHGPPPEAIAAMRQRMYTVQEERVGFLDSVDATLLTPGQQVVHAAYTEALSRRTAAMEALMLRAEAGEQPTEEERQELNEASHELRRLQEAERVALFEAVGVSMGLNREEAASLAGIIREINESTSGSMRPSRPPQSPVSVAPGEYP